MAEIRVEPKRRSLVWLWVIIALIIIAALVYYFLFYQSAPGAAPATTSEAGHALLRLAAGVARVVPGSALAA